MKAEELYKEDVAIETEITNIEIKKSEEIYGQRAIVPGRTVAVIYTTVGKETHNVPKGIEYQNGEWIVVNKVQALRSIRAKNSWFTRFYRKYGSFPKVGMKVKAVANTRGFFQIEI